MKLSEAISKLSELLVEHGDLELFDINYNSINKFTYEICDEDEFPADTWNMPEEFIKS